MGKRQFIDKKKARHFHLIHRSIRDPLHNDEDAPQRVLQEFVPPNLRKNMPNDYHEDQDDEDFISEQDEAELENLDERLGQAAQFGIFFDDQNEYDYLQHLKEVGRSSNAVLLEAKQPKAATSSKPTGIQFHEDSEEDEQESELKEPSEQRRVRFNLPEDTLPPDQQLHAQQMVPGADGELILDPDVLQALEALDDDAYCTGEWEDDFVVQMQEGESEEDDAEEEENESWDSDGPIYQDSDEDYSEDEEAILPKRKSTVGARTSASAWSMTSSAMHRNAGLTLLDDRFDKILEEYTDEEIGELQSDDEEVVGDCDAQQYNQIMDEFLEQCGITPSDANGQEKSPAERMDELRKMMKDVLVIDESMLEEIPDVPSDSEIDWFKSVKNEDEDKWDCETVLTTYTNTENHPSRIGVPRRPRIKLSHKTGLPLGALKPISELPQESVEETNEEMVPVKNLGEARDKDEPKDAKKLRKKMIKEQKNQRRQEKKANKIAFTEETKKVKKSLQQSAIKIKPVV